MDFNFFKTGNSFLVKKIYSKEDLQNLDLAEIDCILFDCDEHQARRIIESLKQKNKKMLFAMLGRDDEFNRRALETLKINFLVSPERTYQRDTIKQRSSGFNHVMAEIAKKNKIKIVSDLFFLTNLKDKKSKAILISRIMQNMRILRKAKWPIYFANFATEKDELLDSLQIKAFGFSIGMSSEQVKECFD